jgi:hypothetical protein
MRFIMFGLSKTVFAGLAVAAGLVLAGCTSTSAKETAGAPLDKGVTCSKCQVTYVKVPVQQGSKPGVVGYRTAKSHECPDCKSAVENFFATGKLEHNCKTCGVALDICEAH